MWTRTSMCSTAALTPTRRRPRPHGFPLGGNAQSWVQSCGSQIHLGALCSPAAAALGAPERGSISESDSSVLGCRPNAQLLSQLSYHPRGVMPHQESVSFDCRLLSLPVSARALTPTWIRTKRACSLFSGSVPAVVHLCGCSCVEKKPFLSMHAHT